MKWCTSVTFKRFPGDSLVGEDPCAGCAGKKIRGPKRKKTEQEMDDDAEEQEIEELVALEIL